MHLITMTNNSSINYMSDKTLDETVVTGQILVGIVYVFLICFGLVFNSTVIHTFRKTRSIQTPTNLFIMGLVYNDLIMIVVGMPFVAASCFNGTWIFGPVLCVGYGFIMTVGGVTSIGILTAISIDRFFVVTKSHLAQTITVFRVKMALIGCFMYSCVWATLPLFGWGGYKTEISKVSCGPDWLNESSSTLSYNIAILSFVFIIPVTVIIACYIKIMIKVRGNRNRISDPRFTTNQCAQRREVNVAVAVLFVIVGFFIAWSPYAISSMWTMMYGPLAVSQTTALLPPLLAKSASVWDPIIYVARNKDFRKAIIAILTSSSNDLARIGRSRTGPAVQEPNSIAHVCAQTDTPQVITVQQCETDL